MGYMHRLYAFPIWATCIDFMHFRYVYPVYVYGQNAYTVYTPSICIYGIYIYGIYTANMYIEYIYTVYIRPIFAICIDSFQFMTRQRARCKYLERGYSVYLQRYGYFPSFSLIFGTSNLSKIRIFPLDFPSYIYPRKFRIFSLVFSSYSRGLPLERS